MSKSRVDLHNVIKQVTGYTNVYYQPPSRMSYPCIMYDRSDYLFNYGDNIKYKGMTRYTITIIGQNPSNEETVNALLDLQYCSYDRQYKTSENLYHDVLTIYW